MPKPSRSLSAEPQATRQTEREFQQLSHDSFPPLNIPLSDNRPYTQEHQMWQQRFRERTLYGIRLIGDQRCPDEWVAVAAIDLVCHSNWAEALHNQDALHGDMLLPVCTSTAVVKKLVEALYTGFVDLATDSEQVLVIADALQVRGCCLTAFL